MSHYKPGIEVYAHKIIGEGPTVGLILPQSIGPVGLQKFTARLARKYTVVTINPGLNEAGIPSREYVSIGKQADNVLNTFDSLGLDKSSLICHSTGCGIGISLAASNPDRISTLILTSPWTYADTHLTVIQNLRKSAAAALDPAQYSRFNAALLFSPEYRRQNEEGFNLLATKAVDNPHDPEVIGLRLDAILAFDARPLIPKIQCDTLILGAKDDQLMPRWFTAEIAERMPAARFIEFETGGHMVPETCAAEFERIVNDFLETGTR